ncbi:hypothetical protein C8R44DRAFT_746959 [Mycena epipterygia]|nr:hypothetical protein C8R44DRAFT_746959 [Mycena epipterygia]
MLKLTDCPNILEEGVLCDTACRESYTACIESPTSGKGQLGTGSSYGLQFARHEIPPPLQFPAKILRSVTFRLRRGGRFSGGWFSGRRFGGAELFAGVLTGLLCTDDAALNDDAGLLAEDEARRADEVVAALLFAEDAGRDELAAALLFAEDAPAEEPTAALIWAEDVPADEFAAALLCLEADETPDGAPDADPDADEGISGGIEKADEETNAIKPVDIPDTGGGTAEEDPDGKYDMPDGRAVEVAVIGVSEKE